jgi:hypothetical protein
LEVVYGSAMMLYFCAVTEQPSDTISVHSAGLQASLSLLKHSIPSLVDSVDVAVLHNLCIGIFSVLWVYLSFTDADPKRRRWARIFLSEVACPLIEWFLLYIEIKESPFMESERPASFWHLGNFFKSLLCLYFTSRQTSSSEYVLLESIKRSACLISLVTPKFEAAGTPLEVLLSACRRSQSIKTRNENGEMTLLYGNFRLNILELLRNYALAVFVQSVLLDNDTIPSNSADAVSSAHLLCQTVQLSLCLAPWRACDMLNCLLLAGVVLKESVDPIGNYMSRY